MVYTWTIQRYYEFDACVCVSVCIKCEEEDRRRRRRRRRKRKRESYSLTVRVGIYSSLAICRSVTTSRASTFHRNKRKSNLSKTVATAYCLSRGNCIGVMVLVFSPHKKRKSKFLFFCVCATISKQFFDFVFLFKSTSSGYEANTKIIRRRNQFDLKQ